MNKSTRTVPNVSVVLNDGTHTDAVIPATLNFHENETVTITLDGDDDTADITLTADILREIRSK